ncbi:MAG TPA: SDR family oxidoreductase [Egibacteraceae bacterium]|nr:SDR family oxidoreductase [Egibacteraceae bacterium]
MGALDGRVAIITGAGRGIGREHALLFAEEGARVVVNDLGGGTDGSGADQGPAHEVVEEIRAMGGEAVANGDNVAEWEGGRRLVQTAIDAFGRLDVLVNNAGILRDRVLVNMEEHEWDAVMAVHLKGHFVPTRFAAAYWREQVKAGEAVSGAVINTSSGAGLFGNFGQTNYSAAKAGIAAFTITAAMELGRYGVRVNAIAPLARTRLTLQTPGLGDVVAPPEAEDAFDVWHPGNISPLVAYLGTADCPFTGGVFHVGGREVGLVQNWTVGEVLSSPSGTRWTVAELAAESKRMLEGRPPLASAGTTIDGLTKEFFVRHQG